MAKNKTRIADATRCLMCYQPICDIACQKKVSRPELYMLYI